MPEKKLKPHYHFHQEYNTRNARKESQLALLLRSYDPQLCHKALPAFNITVDLCYLWQKTLPAFKLAVELCYYLHMARNFTGWATFRGSGRVGSGRVGSGRVGSGRVGSGQGAPNRIVILGIMLARPVPTRESPEYSTSWPDRFEAWKDCSLRLWKYCSLRLR